MTDYGKYLKTVDEKAEEICALSDRIWDHAETAYKEYESSAVLSRRLEENGFRVERGCGGIPTCFIASWGNGSPVIAIQAEFDALEGLSQEAGKAEECAIPGKNTFHGCGHNLFAGGSFAAALAVKDYLAERGSGTLKFFGCPAEEGGAGKVFMVRAGLYAGVDAVISWHPTTFHMVRTRPSLANIMVDYSFKGISAHAGGSPQNGRSALDAAELMNVGANFLREHMDLSSRIHYSFLDVGGTAPNVVQSHATVRYLIRATDNEAVRELKRRVDLLADGAATMTETKVSQKTVSAYSNLITVASLQELANEALHAIPAPEATEEELAFAEQLRATMNLKAKQLSEPAYETAVRDPAPPLAHGGSTDTADVSWVCPTVQFHIGNWVNGTPGHSWQATAQGKCSYAHKTMLFAGKAVAGTVMRLFDRPEALEAVKKEHAEKTACGYVSPLPDDLMPALADD